MKFKLEVPTELDFDLIGVSCHQQDYKLCWHLNQLLNIALSKEEDVYLNIQNKRSQHSYFTFDDKENFMFIELFKNKGLPQHLIPDYQNVDYFIKFNNNSQYNLDDLVKQIRSLDCILTAVKLDPEDLKYAENLIF